MTVPAIEVFSEVPDFLGETPVWSVAEQALYWIDVRAPALHRRNWAGGATATWPLPEVVGCAVLRKSGSLVLGLESGLHVFAPADAKLQMLLPFDENHAGNRLNDAKVDVRGAIWCTTMWDYGKQTTGSLYRVDPSLAVTRIRSDITIPNAICFALDGGRLYFADTPTGRLEYAELSADRLPVVWGLLAGPDAAPGYPDGATVDEEGCIWNARYGGGCVVRFKPDGVLDRRIALPVSQPSSCAFGGPDMSTLFITTSQQGLTPEALAAEPLAGSLLMVDVGVRGRPEPEFEG